MLLCPRCRHAYRGSQRVCPRDEAVLVAPATVDSRIGTVIGNHKLVDMLGTGGMGAVYLGEHIYIGTRAAIKILHEQHAAESDAVTRLLQEARAAAAIGHGNIVAVSDFGETHDGLAYIVMEYVEGRPLDALLEESAPLPLFRAINIVNQIGSALGAAHQKGIVHRDLKPENVMLGDFGEVYVLDWGIAKVLHGHETPLDDTIDLPGDSPATRAGTVLGTPSYMAPERRHGDADPRSDVFALGVILNEMLSDEATLSIAPELVAIVERACKVSSNIRRSCRCTISARRPTASSTSR